MMRNTIVYTIYVFLITLVFSLSASAAEPDLSDFYPASETGYRYGYRYFNGFDFFGYKPSREGLEVKLKAEVKKIKEQDAASKPYHVVIGHSQGGPRALGYATYIKKNDPAEYNRLQAVITMSGIDKGLKALDGGRGKAISRIRTDRDIIYNGIKGALKISDTSAIGLEVAIQATTGSHARTKKNIENWIVDGVLPDELSVWVKPLMDTSNDIDEIAEIRDMIPRSDYLKTFVSDSRKHTYKVKVGRERVWKMKFKWYLGWYLTYEWKDVYETKTAYEDVPKFPDEMPVGYLVGMKSNTLSLCDDDTEEKIRDICDGAEIAMNAAAYAHGLICAANPLHLILGSPGYASDCHDAAEWFGDIDGELNQIKGSKQNDGFVAKESQYIPKTFTDPNNGKTRNVHTNVIGTGKNGYTEFPKHNHRSIKDDNDPKVMLEIQKMIDQSKDRRKR